MQLKRGNSVNLKILVKDSLGNIIENLALATAVKFVMKINKSDDDAHAVVSKNLTNGIVVDYPSIGYISISLTSTDMTINPINYFWGVQITWSPTNVVEIDIKDVDVTNVNPLEAVSVTENIVHV
jgi:hypothetical protein